MNLRVFHSSNIDNQYNINHFKSAEQTAAYFAIQNFY